MFIRFDQSTTIRKTGQKHTHKIFVCICDNCGIEYTTRNSGTLNRKIHFCSKNCIDTARRPGGIIHGNIVKTNLERRGVEHISQSEDVKIKKKQIMLERHGVENPSQLAEVQEKKKQTNLKNLGCEWPLQSDKIKEKIKQTNLERHGVEYPMQSVNCKEKRKQTYMEHYGVENPFQSNKIREKTKQTNLERLGVEHPSQSEIIKEKKRQTCLKNLGCEYPGQSDEVKEKSKQTCLERYDAEHPMKSEEIKSKFDFNEIWQKAHETKKQNGTYKTSKIEDKFYEELIKIFGVENIERYILIFDREIDFYIKTTNTYIEFDGIYWHGLDRTIEQLQSSHHERDIVILKHYHTDRTFDDYCKNNNIKLLRITDEDYTSWLKNNTEFSYDILIELANKHPYTLKT
jgi:hypothetical protein